MGRLSGADYHTPLDAHPVDGGYVFILVYGSSCDWVQNILASEAASLKVDDVETKLCSPKLIDKDAAQKLLGPDMKLPPNFWRIDEFLQMESN